MLLDIKASFTLLLNADFVDSTCCTVTILFLTELHRTLSYYCQLYFHIMHKINATFYHILDSLFGTFRFGIVWLETYSLGTYILVTIPIFVLTSRISIKVRVIYILQNTGPNEIGLKQLL